MSESKRLYRFISHPRISGPAYVYTIMPLPGCVMFDEDSRVPLPASCAAPGVICAETQRRFERRGNEASAPNSLERGVRIDEELQFSALHTGPVPILAVRLMSPAAVCL